MEWATPVVTYDPGWWPNELSFATGSFIRRKCIRIWIVTLGWLQRLQRRLVWDGCGVEEARTVEEDAGTWMKKVG